MYSESVAIADLNENDNMDLAIANGTTDNVSVLWRNGD